LLLAGAVDFGRAFYTAIIVSNMAGEGAMFAAYYPDQDSGDQSCSQQIPIPDPNVTIQSRARMVAKDHGLVIKASDQSNATIDISTDGYGTGCAARCIGRTVTVRVTYTISDLFLPHMLGFSNLPITRSSSQSIARNVFNGSCGGN